MKQTQFLATFTDLENGMLAFISMHLKKDKLMYSSILRDTDCEENVSVKFYPVDKFSFEYVRDETKKLIGL